MAVSKTSGPSAKALLHSYRDILESLAKLDISRTKDSPVGGYGEWLVARAFGGERRGNSSKGADVVTPDGTRLQVKTRWLPMEGDSRQLSAIRNLDGKVFDFIIAVFLDRDFEVMEAWQIPHSAVGRLAKRAEHTNSHRLVLGPGVCGDADCREITAKIRAADPERRR